MAPKHRALRLCGLAAVAAAAWPTNDELAMVQSTVELTAAHRLQLAESGSQLPGGFSPISEMPQPNISMDGLVPSFGNMTPMIETVHLIDDTLRAFRNKKLAQRIFDWGYEFATKVEEHLEDTRKELKEIADGPMETPEEAGRKVAEMLVLYESKERALTNVTLDLAAPVNAEINSTMKVEKLLDMSSISDFILGLMNVSLSEYSQNVHGHANGTLTEMGEMDCENFRKMVTLLGFNNKKIKNDLAEIGPALNHSDDILLRTPMVMMVADIMPEFMHWVKIIGEVMPRICQAQIDTSRQVIIDSVRLLNKHANCGLDEDDALRGSATTSRPLGVSLLFVALAAAFAWAH